ncbi:MAG: glycoside hydrolase family 5 protein [Treponema sp.]|jgi:hypothetical protein|nr:glycoside hydrolase family 5 protein [Treponema sp.]
MVKIVILPFLILYILLFGACVTDSSGRNTAGDPELYAVPSLTLHVEGNKIINENGKEVRLTGVNIPSLEWNPQGENLLASVYEVFANWNCNVVRLPVDNNFWFGRPNNNETWYLGMIADGGKAYRELIDKTVQLASDFGKYLILDNHAYESASNDTLEFWKDAAARYRNNPSVLFGLLNEPTINSWQVWRDGGAAVEKEYVGHQKLVDEIRALGANNIIIAGGLEWGYNLAGIADGYGGRENGYELTDTDAGNGIIYDSHAYPWKDPATPFNTNKTKVLSTAVKAPVLIGEFGIHNGPMNGVYNGNTYASSAYPDYLAQLLDWMEANSLNFTAWSFHPSASPCMLLNNQDFAPTPWFGAIVKKRLLSYPNSNAHLDKLPEKPANN